MYETELKELGLTENEIKIYLALLRQGALNPTKIAEKTGLHRSYIYDTTEKLLEKGIINSIFIGNKRHFQAINPKILKEIYELRLKKLDSILPQLSNLFNSRKEEVKVELYKGKKVYLTLLKDIISEIKVNDEILLFGIDETSLFEIEPIYLKQYLNLIKTKKVKERIIIKKGLKKIKSKNLLYKELEEEFIGKTAQIIYRDKVAIFILGNPYYLIIIENKDVTDTYKKQFELLWNIAK